MIRCLSASTCARIQKISDEGNHLYRSLGDLVLYATGAAACSTSDLLLVLESINSGLDNIEKHLNKSYFEHVAVYPAPDGVLERIRLSKQKQV